MIFGEYDLSNNYYINAQIYNDDTSSTALHELIHMFITRRSSYGNFMYLQYCINAVDSNYKYINNYLMLHSIKAQEAAATFSEVLYLIMSKGFTYAKKHIILLKNNNFKYYKYIYILLPLLKYLKENKESNFRFKITSKEMYKIIEIITLNSFDVNLTEISEQIFKSKKQLKKFTSRNTISEKYFPNKRFILTIRLLLNKLYYYKDCDYSEETMKEILSDCKADINITNRSKEDCEIELKKNINYILKIYIKSRNFKIIQDRLSNIKAEEMTINDAICSAIPNSQNKIYELIKATNSLYSEINNIEHGISLVLGDKKILEELNNNNKLLYFDPQNLKNFPSKVVVFLFDYLKKSITSILINKKEIARLKSNKLMPTVINYKFYDFIKNFLCNVNCDVFIYCDRSYKHSKKIIEKYTNEIKPAQIIDYESNKKTLALSILVIKIKEKQYFILPIVDVVKQIIYDDYLNGNINIDFSLDLDQDFISILDLVINCLFYC